MQLESQVPKATKFFSFFEYRKENGLRKKSDQYQTLEFLKHSLKQSRRGETALRKHTCENTTIMQLNKMN